MSSGLYIIFRLRKNTFKVFQRIILVSVGIQQKYIILLKRQERKPNALDLSTFGLFLDYSKRRDYIIYYGIYEMRLTLFCKHWATPVNTNQKKLTILQNIWFSRFKVTTLVMGPDNRKGRDRPTCLDFNEIVRISVD